VHGIDLVVWFIADADDVEASVTEVGVTAAALRAWDGSGLPSVLFECGGKSTSHDARSPFVGGERDVLEDVRWSNVEGAVFSATVDGTRMRDLVPISKVAEVFYKATSGGACVKRRLAAAGAELYTTNHARGKRSRGAQHRDCARLPDVKRALSDLFPTEDA